MRTQKHSGKRTIRRQLIKYIGLFMILPLCLGLMALNIYLQKITKENREAYETSAVSQMKANADQMIEIINYATSMMITNRDVIDDIRVLNSVNDEYEGYNAKNDLSKRLQEMESSVLNPVDGKIAVLTNSGYLIGSTNQSKTSVDYKGTKWYGRVLQNGRKTTFCGQLSGFFREMTTYKALDRQYLYIGRTLQDYSGKSLGIIIAQLSEKKIWGNFADIVSRNPGSALYMYNKNGELQMKRGEDTYPPENLYDMAQSWGIKKDQITRVNEDGYQYLAAYLDSAENLLVYSIPEESLADQSPGILQGILVMIILLILLAVTTMIYFSGKLSRPLTEMVKELDQSDNGILKLKEPENSFYEVQELVESYNMASRRIEELIGRVQEESKEKEKSRYEMLMSQISPHFIFNTVNSIRIMAEQEKNVKHALAALGKILYAVYTTRDGMTTVGQETALIQSYVDIMKMRFGDSFLYCNYIPVELYLYEIPAFTLQPIVENAILHGVKDIPFGQIIVSAVEYETDFIISVFNNGNTADEKKIEMILSNPVRNKSSFTSIGLYNVNSRLKMLYGETYGLIYNGDKKNGFEIWIRIPKRGKEDEKGTDR